MDKQHNPILTIAIVICSFFLGSCGIYSLSGISLNYETTKTISIQNFYNDVNLGPANLSQTFTNSLRDYFQQNTQLDLIEEQGDIQFEGSITGYRLTPVAPQAAQDENGVDAAAQTRLTITVQVTYINTKDDTFNFENKNFSFFDDFSNDESITSVEDGLIETINTQIIQDVFNASVANW